MKNTHFFTFPLTKIVIGRNFSKMKKIRPTFGQPPYIELNDDVDQKWKQKWKLAIAKPEFMIWVSEQDQKGYHLLANLSRNQY